MLDLQKILDEWQNNIQFREAFKKNPEEALKEAGFDITSQELDKIKSLIKSQHHDINEELDKRISK